MLLEGTAAAAAAAAKNSGSNKGDDVDKGQGEAQQQQQQQQQGSSSSSSSPSPSSLLGSALVSERHAYKYRCAQCSLAFKTAEKLALHSQYHVIRDATRCRLCSRDGRMGSMLLFISYFTTQGGWGHRVVDSGWVVDFDYILSVQLLWQMRIW